MAQWLRHYWDRLRTSYWFLPAVMSGLAAVFSLLLVSLDETLQDHWLLDLGWIYTGSADGARQLLAAVAGSMITVAGTVFSVMIVALSLASNQFGPRLLRTFMRDRGNQLVLGTFIATFVYCLLVLRTVRGEDDGDFVPHVAVTGAVLLALASVGVLIYFLHHAAVSVQAPTIIANVGAQLQASIEALFPEELGQPAEDNGSRVFDGSIPPGFEQEARPVPAACDGYVQAINSERLLSLAAENELLVRVERRPGQFVVKGGSLALVWPAGRPEFADQIQDAFIVGSRQTSEQDAEFVMNQLVEVAVRALSTGVNDPFTVFSCLDYLGAALSKLAGKKIPSPYRLDDKERLRVIAAPDTFAQMADTAFDQIRRYGRSSTDVLGRMLDVIAVVLTHVRRDEDHSALMRHAMLINQCADCLPQDADRQEIHQRYAKVLDSSRQCQERNDANRRSPADG